MEPDHVVRGVLMGDTGVGKTSLVRRLAHGAFEPAVPSTVGCDVGCVQRGATRVQLWDLAGDPRFQNMTRAFTRNIAFALVLFDVTAPRTLEGAIDAIRALRAECSNQRVFVALVANKIDLGTARIVSRLEATERLAALDADVRYYEVSVKANDACAAAIDDALRHVHALRLEREILDDRVHGVQSLPRAAPAGAHCCPLM